MDEDVYMVLLMQVDVDGGVDERPRVRGAS